MSFHIKTDNLGYAFASNQSSVTLFKDINALFESGCSYSITGPSGAGKSTLLMLLAQLENPNAGKIEFFNDAICLSESEVREHFGFVFQHFHLLPELDALNNVALPLKLKGDKAALVKAKEVLAKVGLSHRETHKPDQLSGGEKQRVAIARALVFKPKFIFADEPTGNLDPKSAKEIADLLFEQCSSFGTGLILVTHSHDLAKRADVMHSLEDCSLKTIRRYNEKVA